MKKTYTLKVPASSANLGSGFDSIGLCLNIWNEIEFFEGDFSIKNYGFGSSVLPTNENNLIYKCYLKTNELLDKKNKDISIICNNSIPVFGGLGSSSAAVISGIMIAFKINNIDIKKDEIFQIAADFEGHPDNVGPAIYGGITIGFLDSSDWHISNVKYSDELKIISFISEQKILTSESRKELPNTVNRKDAVYNISRSAVLINALNNNDFSKIKFGFQDKIHEQYRIPKIKGFNTISNAALNAGALGSYLSGSGPTISAITYEKELTINYEMLDAADKLGLIGQGIICSISKKGAEIFEK